jgi:hypothetical protein
VSRFRIMDASTQSGIPTLNLASLCTSPWAWATAAASAKSAPAPTPATSVWLQPALTLGFNFTDKATQVLHGVFAHPWTPAFIRFGFAGGGNSGITLEGVITLDVEYWNAHSEERRIELLCHELTHIPQWNHLGRVAFLLRYKKEFALGKVNYEVPPALNGMPISSLEPDFCDERFTLDQICERTGAQAVAVAKAKGFIP